MSLTKRVIDGKVSKIGGNNNVSWPLHCSEDAIEQQRAGEYVHLPTILRNRLQKRGWELEITTPYADRNRLRFFGLLVITGKGVKREGIKFEHRKAEKHAHVARQMVTLEAFKWMEDKRKVTGVLTAVRVFIDRRRGISKGRQWYGILTIDSGHNQDGTSSPRPYYGKRTFTRRTPEQSKLDVEQKIAMLALPWVLEIEELVNRGKGLAEAVKWDAKGDDKVSCNLSRAQAEDEKNQLASALMVEPTLPKEGMTNAGKTATS